LGDDAMEIISTAYQYFLPERACDDRTVTAVTVGHPRPPAIVE
jgi:hypothetical protein